MNFGLALQQVVVQSVFFIIPALFAGFLSNDPADAVRFVSLSILTAALWQVLMILKRGPVGSGYPLPASFPAGMLAAYVAVGHAGYSFGAAGAMLIITGLAAVALTYAVRRLRLVLPNEVAGVVVIMTGLSLIVLAVDRLGLRAAIPADRASVMVALASMATMAAVWLSRSKAAPYSILIGAGVGVVLSVWQGLVRPDAGALIAAQPWFALPQPWLPRFDQVTPAPLAAFLVTLLALKATTVGTLVVLQRNLDANWSKPDAPPIRRGLLANGLGIMASGFLGSLCSLPSASGMGLSIAMGTLARSILWTGSALLVALALCPKAVIVFVLTPEPVKAAMLLFLAGFILTQGCQLVTTRLLDTRRSMVVAFGLTAGLVEAVAPLGFVQSLPALASPVAIGALVAFMANLLTLPLVQKRASLTVDLVQPIGLHLSDWLAGVAGSWSLKPQTARHVEQSIGELVELLQERQAQQVTVMARSAEDRVEYSLQWTGQALPEPPATANADDLMGDDITRQRFSMWIATRQSLSYRQRPTADGHEVVVVFED
ncbi:MAG: hypothetical protein H7228_01350 [Polaromonas sp.]|nr:hypothetical protein [Polaromonas sp.]